MKSKSKLISTIELLYIVKELGRLFLLWNEIRDVLGEIIEEHLDADFLNIDIILAVAEKLDEMFMNYQELVDIILKR